MPNGKSYRHYSVPSRESFRLKSNDILTSNADDENIIYPSASVIYSKTMEEQLKRERQRRLMVDRILNLFDEDGKKSMTKERIETIAHFLFRKRSINQRRILLIGITIECFP